MRKDELKTISEALKATVLCEFSPLHLNTDGTTKNQKKIGGVIANIIVLGVNELQDGTAASAVHMSMKFEKL